MSFPGRSTFMFSSVVKKRSVALAAPLLLFSVACSGEVATPTAVPPTSTPVPEASPLSALPTATPTPTAVPPTPTATPNLQDQLLQELLDARATATALTPAPMIITPTPTPAMLPPPATPMVMPPAEFGNRVGNLAPDFTLTEISTGQPVRLAELTAQGRPVVLYFFTTW